MTKKDYGTFRQNYEKKISKKLEISKEEFDIDYYTMKQPIVVTVFGALLLLYGLYILFKISAIYGLLIIILSLFIIYGRLKKNKLVFRISKNGIWTKEFGLLYFRHIDRFEFYRLTGKFSSEQLKIYIKNYKLYEMDKPFLEQHISHIDNYENLEKNLNKALSNANKRNENKNYR